MVVLLRRGSVPRICTYCPSPSFLCSVTPGKPADGVGDVLVGQALDLGVGHDVQNVCRGALLVDRDCIAHQVGIHNHLLIARGDRQGWHSTWCWRHRASPPGVLVELAETPRRRWSRYTYPALRPESGKSPLRICRYRSCRWLESDLRALQNGAGSILDSTDHAAVTRRRACRLPEQTAKSEPLQEREECGSP